MHAILVERHSDGVILAAAGAGLSCIVVGVAEPCCSAIDVCLVVSVRCTGAGQHHWARRLAHRVLVRP